VNVLRQKRDRDWLASSNPIPGGDMSGDAEPKKTLRVVIHVHLDLRRVAEHDDFPRRPRYRIFVLAARWPITPMQHDARGRYEPIDPITDREFGSKRCLDQAGVPPDQGSATLLAVLDDLALKDISLIDKASYLGVFWTGEHVRWRAALQCAPVMQHDHAVGESNRLLKIMRDENHRNPNALTQLGQFAVEFSPSDLIDR
jgi:hypothetical protein